MILSILTPAVPSRLRNGTLGALCIALENQIGALPVEHLVLLDNKRRTIGEKRDALLRAAHGEYVTFVDDDDWIAEDYVSEIVRGIRCAVSGEASSHLTPDTLHLAPTVSPDVITFLQHATVNGQCGMVEFGLGNANESFQHLTPDPSHLTPAPMTLPVTKRNAWHVCAWRRELAILSNFPAINYGEDWAFSEKLCRLKGLRSTHIDKVLHFYRHDDQTSEAMPGET